MGNIQFYPKTGRKLKAPALDKMVVRGKVALSDAAATLSATQIVDSGVFTITPTAGRTLTTATAAALVAAIPGAKVGNWVEITIVNTAAQDVTLAGGTDVTVTGSAVVNNSSGTFLVLLANVTSGSEAVTIYRK